MGLSPEEKSSRLFKKSFGAAETLLARDFFEEPKLGNNNILPSQIWSDANNIPYTAPTLSDGQSEGVVKYYELLELTHISGSQDLAYSDDTLKDTIPFNYSDGSYNYALFKNDGTTQIPFGQGDWLVDTSAGVLTFYGTLPSGVNASSPPKISFYQYIGDKGLVQSGATSGINVKDPVIATTTGQTDATYSTSLSGFTNLPSEIDGITLFNEGDRFLIKNQTTELENGIYEISGTTLVRAFDHDGTPIGEVGINDYTFVLSGNTNIATSWVLGSTDALDPNKIYPGVNSQLWKLFSSGLAYTADEQAIKLSGTTFSLDLDETLGNSGLYQSVDGLRLDTSITDAISGNTSGITSLSTELSTEISNRVSGDTSLSTELSEEISTRISEDTSLSTELSTEISTRISGDTSLSTALSEEISTTDSEVTSLSTELSAEISTSASADTSLSTAISTGDSSLSTALSEEISTTGSEVTSLSTELSTEISTRDSADTSLSTAIENIDFTSLENEITGNTSSISSLESQVIILTGDTISIETELSTEISTRSSETTSLSNGLSEEISSRTSGDLSLSTELSTEISTTDSEVTSLSTAISTEISTTDSEVTSLSTELSGEISSRTSGDTSLSTALSEEISTSASADTSLSTELSTEISTSVSADTSLSTAISIGNDGTTSLSTALSTEISTTDSEVTSLSTAISTGDSSLSTALSTEISTRNSADISLSTELSTEISTRDSADTSLETELSTEISTRSSETTSLSTEISTNSTGITSLEIAVDNPLNSAGIHSEPSILDNGNGTVTLGTGDYVFYSDTNFNTPLQKYTITGGTFTFINDDTNYLIADYNGGSPIIYSSTSRANINQSSVHPIITVYRYDNELEILTWDEMGKGLSNKISDRLVRTDRFVPETGSLIIGEAATRYVTLTAGVVWYGAVNHNLDAMNSSGDTMDLWYHSSGVWTNTGITQYDNTQYDDGTDLVTLGNAKYGVNWVFRTVGDDKKMLIVLGTDSYSLGEAQSADIPPLPEIAITNSILVGKIIVVKDGTTAEEITSAFETTFASTPITDHNSLSNLEGGTVDQYNHMTDAEYINVQTIPTLSTNLSTETTLRISGDTSLETAIDNFSGVTSQTAGSGLTYLAGNQTLNVNVDDYTIKIVNDELRATETWVESDKTTTISSGSGSTNIVLDYEPVGYVASFINGIEYLVSPTPGSSATDMPFFFDTLPVQGSILNFDTNIAGFGLQSGVDLIAVKYSYINTL
jgi:hypothetical protein